MEKICNSFITLVHFFAAIVLVLIAALVVAWSAWDIISLILNGERSEFIPTVLQSVGGIVIAAAIIDVGQYMIEEEVFKEKELRDPREARKTITKIMAIISIAVSIEGLVYIFKAGTSDLSMLLYPAILIFVAAVLIVALGIYQKFSVTVERFSQQTGED